MRTSVAAAVYVILCATGIGPVPAWQPAAPAASADPADDGQSSPEEDADAPGAAGWEEQGGPPDQADRLNDRDQQSYQDYLNGVSGGPVNAPAHKRGSAPPRGGAAPRSSCPRVSIHIGRTCITP